MEEGIAVYTNFNVDLFLVLTMMLEVRTHFKQTETFQCAFLTLLPRLSTPEGVLLKEKHYAYSGPTQSKDNQLTNYISKTRLLTQLYNRSRRYPKTLAAIKDLDIEVQCDWNGGKSANKELVSYIYIYI